MDVKDDRAGSDANDYSRFDNVDDSDDEKSTELEKNNNKM